MVVERSSTQAPTGPSRNAHSFAASAPSRRVPTRWGSYRAVAGFGAELFGSEIGNPPPQRAPGVLVCPWPGDGWQERVFD